MDSSDVYLSTVASMQRERADERAVEMARRWLDGWTQEEIGERYGMDRSRVSRTLKRPAARAVLEDATRRVRARKARLRDARGRFTTRAALDAQAAEAACRRAEARGRAAEQAGAQAARFEEERRHRREMAAWSRLHSGRVAQDRGAG